MSQLQRRISGIGRREGRGIGFGQARREQPRGMLLGLLVTDAAAAKGAVEAGVDVILLRATDAIEAAKQIQAAGAGKMPIGAVLPGLDVAGAEALREASCDFVVSPLEGTAAEAVDTDAMGQAVLVEGNIAETTLRALGPLGLDALFVSATGGGLTLAGQLDLVRLASFASTPLMVTVGMSPSAAELRVLRDAGTAVVLAPEGATMEQVRAIGEALTKLPAAKKGKRESAEMAIVPSVASHGGAEEDDDGDDDD